MVREREIDLSPKLAKKVYEGDGCAYCAWSPDDLPMLHQGNVGAAKLALEKDGFALPRYSDSSKVAYVPQGNGVTGIVLPEKEEKVLPIKKGDAVALPFGVIMWWYNKKDTDLVVLFLGDTSKAHKSGSFIDFFLTDSNGIFTGFSTKHRNGMALNCEEAPLDVDIKRGGRVVVLSTKNLPLASDVGLGADLVRLDDNAICSLGFSCDSALLVTYIVRGSGRVQVVGVDGKHVLEMTIKGGDLFIVPSPIFTHLAESIATWKALSLEVVRASFNVDLDIEQLFHSKRAKEASFFPPPN
ncbi:RmlC-like cupins superfamily protein [Actinidia rufa]|uniref:RmlC-like cupins superfamily protein n=1 Tax=Actinidia rufa TaxID=165716 RepID=A0A7J0FLQ0_9ERIC|nr:RmlC-like cupins superfamily protein [Actinidia rufa]